MEQHLSSLQDIVRLTIRQELAWAEVQFRRITMSHDADDNPAELYGADGKIYYRKAGGAGVEIGAGVGLWQDTGLYAKLLTVRPIDMQYESIIHVDEIVGGIAAGGFNVSAMYGEPLKLKTDHGYTTIEDTTQSAKFSPTQIDFYRDIWLVAGEEINFGAANTAKVWQDAATHDLKFYDTILGATKTLTELASGGGSGLWEVSGIYIRPLSGKPVTMEGEEITKLPEIWGPLNSDFSLHGSNAADTTWIEFLKWGHATERLSMINLIDPTSARDAANKQWVDAHNWAAGDITSGTLAVARGGTDIATYTQGDILYASAANTLAKLPKGTATHVLTMNAGATAPEWAAQTGGSGLWEVSGIYIRPLSGKPVTMEGEEITKLPEIWGPLNSDFSLHGSNAADTTWIEFLKWGHATERLSMINLIDPTSARDAANKQWVDAHNWAAGDITSGTLAVARGGTGVTGDTYDADKVDGYHASSLCKLGSGNPQSNYPYFNSGYGIKQGTVAYVVLFDSGTVQIDNDVYVIDNCSALSFTDRTPFYSGDALAEIGLIKGNDNGIDHATLPAFVRTEVGKMEQKDGKWSESKVSERNLGNMISMLTVAVQQITGRLEKLEIN